MNNYFMKYMRVFHMMRIIRTISVFVIFASVFVMFSYSNGKEVEAGGDNGPIVVSMGDSYSSGEGVEPYFGQQDKNGKDKKHKDKVKNLDWLAHRSTNAWSGMLTLDGVEGEMSLHWNENWFFVAASGAETCNVINVPQEKTYNISSKVYTTSLPPQLTIFDTDKLKGKNIDYVTITIGGNDLGFTDIVTKVIYGTPFIDYAGFADRMKIAEDAVSKTGFMRKKLKDTYKAIYNKTKNMGEPTIIVAGYPRLFESIDVSADNGADSDVDYEKVDKRGVTGKGFTVHKYEARRINNGVVLFNNLIEKKHKQEKPYIHIKKLFSKND